MKNISELLEYEQIVVRRQHLFKIGEFSTQVKFEIMAFQ